MTKEQANNLRNHILNDNKILYCMKDRPCTETCMCWKLECNDGWLNVIDELSKSLEALNYIYYPKFRVRIQADQVKEKFGLLAFYHSIIVDPPKWMSLWKKISQKFFDKIAKLDFKKAEVIDHDTYDEIKEIELTTEDEYKKEKKANARCCNVKVFEKDGKYIKKTTFTHYKKTHFIATKHKFLYRLLMKRHLIEKWPMRLFDFNPSYEQQCISHLLDDKTKKLIKKAEDDCYNVCELCGYHISDDNEYSPRCITRGWIQYLCKDCANKTKYEYIMNGSIWKDGKEIMTKKQYAEEKAKIEERFKVAQEDDDLEEIDDENQD